MWSYVYVHVIFVETVEESAFQPFNKYLYMYNS